MRIEKPTLAVTGTCVLSVISVMDTAYCSTTWASLLTCHTPTTALAMRIRRMTKGSTKAVTVSSPSSNQASTCGESMVSAVETTVTMGYPAPENQRADIS